MLLVLLSGATALTMEGSLLNRPLHFTLVMLGLFLTGGSANALNQYFERRLDAQMKRTSRRRPLPLGRIEPAEALLFSLLIGVSGVLLFGLIFNWLTAVLSLATIVFYALIYTLWLKPTTDQNIVIGGAAGAMAPVGAWAAATGTVAVAPWTLFLIVFLWTPPHFWALALLCKDDYKRVKLPMLPISQGVESTLRQIVIYSLLMVAASFAPVITGANPLYLIIAVPMGVLFLHKARKLKKSGGNKEAHSLFGFSIVYLFSLLLAVIVSSLIA